MKLRQRVESVTYASDSEEDELSNASEHVVVMNPRRRKVEMSQPDAGALLRYAQPNIKNTSAAPCLTPEKPFHSVVIEDSDEDFVEVGVMQRKRTTSQVNRNDPSHEKRNNSRSARKSYKEISSSDDGSEDDKQNACPRDAPDLSTFSFNKRVSGEEVQKFLVPRRRRLVKAVSLPQEVPENPAVLSEDNQDVGSDVEVLKLRKSKRMLSKTGCSPIMEYQDSIEEDGISNAPAHKDVKSVQEPMALNLHVDVYGLCTHEGKSASNLVKRIGQVEKILAVRNRNSDAAIYSIKECGKGYRSVVNTKEALLRSKCPQLLRNFVKKMDELQRVDGNPGDREDAPAFNPLYLHIDRIIDQEERKGGRRYYLVKWCGLPYTEATWEIQEDLMSIEDQPAVNRFLWIHSSSSRVAPTSSGKLLFRDGRVLRDYQEKGLAWMDHNFQSQVNCILADEMGLGKTMQAVSMLQNLRVKRRIKGPFLVIAPVSTLGHWQREVESLTDMNCVVFSGSAEDRRMIKEYEFYYQKSNLIKINILLTSFEILMKDQAFLSKQEWKYVVVDEAHRLKSKCSKTTCCLKQLSIRKGGLLLLTGTPIQNNTREIFSLLNILDSQLFCSEEEFLLKYGDLKNAEQVKDLQDNVLRPRLLRRLKEDVEKSIPLKEETIIWVELTKEQRCYYRAILKNRISDLLKGSQSSNIPNLRNVAMELRKLCNHPFLCNGLQEDINSKLKSPAGDLSNEAEKSSEALCLSSGKMMLLEKLLPMLKNAGHRVLLFSQFAIMLDLLEDYLISKNYTYERIDGSVRGSERQAAIDRYSAKDSDTFLFLLSTRAGGLGITLTAADTCIIYDSDWNPQNDLQAMARCHRIGQKKDVRIYRLITKNTYEQHLFECSSRKYGLDEAILGSMQGAISDNEHSANIENLLKRGAYSILKEDGEAEAAAFHAQNIEQILESRTEKRLVGGRGQNTFSVATFISNPEVDSMLDEEPTPDGDPQQFWQELLPEACSTALNESKQVHTSCGPRKRLVVNYREGRGNSEQESSDEEHESSKGRRLRIRKKNVVEPGTDDDIKQWSEKELKQLENWLIELGTNRTEEIMAAAGLEHYGIQEVQQLCDVLIALCRYFQAKNAAVTNILPLDKNTEGLPNGQNPTSDLPFQNGSDHWNVSTFRNISNEAPTTVCLHSQEDGKNMGISETGDEKGGFPNVIMHPTMGKVELPTFPPYAQRALGSQALTKRLEKKATRYLQVLQERETLAKAFHDGKVLPPYVRRIKKLPPWWGEAEDADLLLGVHRHGHRNFSKIREDKSLCFSSRLDLLKSIVSEQEGPHLQNLVPMPGVTNGMENQTEGVPPDQEAWPQDSVLAMRLKQLIQALQSPSGLTDRLKSKVLQEAVARTFHEERVTTSSFTSKMHSRYQHISSTRCLLGAHGMAVPSKQSRVELSNLNPIALSNLAQQTVSSAMGTLPFKTGPTHNQRSRGKENMHLTEVMEVPNSSSEGSGDEDFQRQSFGKSPAESLSRRQWGVPPEMVPSMIMDGASLHHIEAKKAQRHGKSSNVMPKRGSMWVLGKEKASSPIDSLRQPNQAGLCTNQESREWPPNANVYSYNGGDRALDSVNQTTITGTPTTFLDRDLAKRKTNSDATPSISNKKPKGLGKQQTLHGFLAPRSAIKPIAPC